MSEEGGVEDCGAPVERFGGEPTVDLVRRAKAKRVVMMFVVVQSKKRPQ